MEEAIIEEPIQQISKEISKSGANDWTNTKIIKELSKLNETNSKKLREKTIELLNIYDPTACEIYKKFSKLHVYTSKETLEEFNRGQIIKSLLIETKISRTLAEKITNEVENEIKDLDMNFISAPLIRELVCAKLISYGLNDVRNDYTRVGVPIFDAEKRVLINLEKGEMAKEYVLLKKIPKKARDLIFNSTIKVEDLEGFCTRIYGYTHICTLKENIESTLITNFVDTTNIQKYVYSPIAIFGLNTVASCFLKTKKDFEKTKNLIIDLIRLNEKSLISCELYLPSTYQKELKNKNYDKLRSIELTNLLIKNNLNIVNLIDSKYSLKLINLDKNLLILNNSREEKFMITKDIASKRKGIFLMVSINLEKLNDKNENNFFNNLDQIIEQIKELFEIKKNDFITINSGIDINELSIGIGLTSTENIAKKLNIEKDKLNKKIINKITLQIENCEIFGATKEALIKFSKINEKETTPFNESEKDEKTYCLTGITTDIKEVNNLIDKNIELINFIKN
ncbi:MAG: hypothetical protein PHQ98_00615 [Candidatus ainarchaeum sp.]|nr:hypothetical protein [Candidatus ainarchaeum sp.]